MLGVASHQCDLSKKDLNWESNSICRKVSVLWSFWLPGRAIISEVYVGKKLKDCNLREAVRVSISNIGEHV